MYRNDKHAYSIRVLIICASICIIAFLAASVISSHRRIIRIRDREVTPFHTMINEIGAAGAIFIGEAHTEPAHHQTQLDVIRALHDRDVSLAVALEMIKKDDQADLDAWVAGETSEEDFVPIFLRNWGFDWHLYRDIFLYVREHRIPLVALNVPTDITRKVGETGFASLSDEELAQLPPGVTCDLDATYMEHLALIFQIKSRSGRSFEYFCEAQVLWDQSMAWYLAQYMKEHPGSTVVVLAGSMHAWKYGIPKQKEKYLSSEQRVIVPDLPIIPEAVQEEHTDYLVLYR